MQQAGVGPPPPLLPRIALHFFCPTAMAPLLLIDGDRNFRQALAIALKLDGYEVLATDSVDGPLADLSRAGYRCCIVDARLAGASTIVDRLAEAGACVVVTAFDPDLLANILGRHPGIVTLEKPFRVEDLRALLAPQSAVA